MKNRIALLSLVLLTGIITWAQDKPEGLFLNAKAPDVKGTYAGSQPFAMKEIRKAGKVVVIFYQGSWAPADVRMLKRFQDSLSFIGNKKATLVAITPEKDSAIAETVKKLGLTFPVIWDQGNKWATAYAGNYQVDRLQVERQKGFGTDLLRLNDQKVLAFLPVPAAYVVNKEGGIEFRFFESTDTKKRVWVKDVLKYL